MMTIAWTKTQNYLAQAPIVAAIEVDTVTGFTSEFEPFFLAEFTSDGGPGGPGGSDERLGSVWVCWVCVGWVRWGWACVGWACLCCVFVH